MTVNLDQVFFDGQRRWCAYTADLKVLPAARGRGIGDGLMQYAIQVARAQAADVLVLTTVAADNPAGLRKNEKLYPQVHMQHVADLETVFFPCGMPVPSHGKVPSKAPFYTRPLDFTQRTERQQALDLWQKRSRYRHGQRAYEHFSERFFPPAQTWLGLFKSQPAQHLIGFLGLWDQRACRQITLPNQPPVLQQWLYGQGESVALWCVVHGVLEPQYRRHFSLLLGAAHRWASAHGGRLLGLAMDRSDPLYLHLPHWPQQRNGLRLLSSERPKKAYPFQAELALG